MIMIVIHPKWEMDEKARIFRIWVWFKPIHPPRAAEEIARVVSRVLLREGDVSKNSEIGGNFMAVARSRPVVRDEP